MKNSLNVYTFFFLMIPFCVCNAQENKTTSNLYTFKKGDQNGIGKWYLGREIAYVMGFEGIDWLERSTRELEENTSTLIKNMNIQPTDVIADIGAGSGYHVFKIAPLVPKGGVYAVDIQAEMLQAMLLDNRFKIYKNIELVLGDEKSVHLKENSIDKVLMVDVYHEFNFPKEMILSIKKSMKENGQLFLIEYRAEDESVPIKKVHKMSKKQSVKELKAAGFVLEKNIQNLPWQHCMVFVKAN